MDRYAELCSMLERELMKVSSRGEISNNSLDMIYKLTESMKNLKKLEGYSNYSGEYSHRGYSDDYSRDYSGREMYGQRENYSKGYSGHTLKEHLEEAMHQAKDDRTRNELMRMIERM